MAIYKEDIADIEISTGNIHRTFMHHAIGEWDDNGDVFGVRLFKDGEAVSLSGLSCVGYFEKPDGTTVVIEGNKRDQKIAYVQLPQTCYAVTGTFKLTIKLTTANSAVTVRIVDGTIVRTAEGGMVDPGSLIPDMSGLDDLLLDINDVLATISAYSIEAVQISGTRYRIEVEEAVE